MAIATGKKSDDEFKRYIGIAPVKILAVNPTKEEIHKLTGRDVDEPQYLSETEVGEDSRKVKQLKIDFYLQTDAEKCDGIKLSDLRLSFFLNKASRLNKDGNKIQVIDKYGRTAWVTKEEYKNKAIPMYSSGPANLDTDYRPCYIGEENLIKFLITYLNIPSPMKYIKETGKWVFKDNPEDSLARLDKIDSYFSGTQGDISEIRETIALQPENRVKVLVGIKTTDENKQYHDIYKNMFLTLRTTDYSRIQRDVEDTQSRGGYPNTEFAFCPLREYKLAPTNLSSAAQTAQEDPFAQPAQTVQLVQEENFFGEEANDDPWASAVKE